MRKILLVFLLAGCTSANNDTMIFECEQQFQGEACFKLGQGKAEAKDALPYYRKGCSLGSSNSCLALHEKGDTEDKGTAVTSLKNMCTNGNKVACEKSAALPGAAPVAK